MTARAGAARVAMVVPGDVDDPGRPSGGNAYDRRLRDGLRDSGWDVSWHPVPGAWPDGDLEARSRLAQTLRDAPADAALLVDGLVACAAPEVLRPVAAARPVVVLVHMPLGAASPTAYALEGAVLRSAEAVVVTSEWGRRWLEAAYGLPSGRIHVAHPGTDPAAVSTGSAHGGNLLCVASVVRGKGHDVLVAALSGLTDLSWRCSCVGSLERDRGFAGEVERSVATAGLGGRVSLAGPLAGPQLEEAYAAADLLVLPTRGETWGMVVGEALARGVPVVASDVGGVPEALGTAPGGDRPGLLVPAEDPDALAYALRRWLEDGGLRSTLRAAALTRRADLPGWRTTTDEVAGVLAGVAA